MYEQHLYTRSNYGGIYENRPGFTTVCATPGLNKKDIEMLEHHCEYSVSKKVLEKCGCQRMPNIKYFMKDINETYIIGQSCFRKEEGISDREVFLVHNFAVKKDCQEYQEFMSNLYHMAGEIPFITEFEDRKPKSEEHSRQSDNFLQPISDAYINDESQFCFNDQGLAAIGISRGIFQMMVYAVISAIGTKKKIFINLNCEVEQMTEQAIMVMQHIYAVLPNVLRGRVGYQTFYTGENVKNNIMIYFFPNKLIEMGKAVEQIGERSIKQDYLFYLSEPVGIQPADAFVEIQSQFGFIDLNGLYQIKKNIDTSGEWNIEQLKHVEYEKYCLLAKTKSNLELYESQLDMCCEEAVHMEDLFAIIQTIFQKMAGIFAENDTWMASTKKSILKHTDRIRRQCDNVYSEILSFPIKVFQKNHDTDYKEVMEKCLLSLLNDIHYDTDHFYPSDMLTGIVNMRYTNKELKNEMNVLRVVHEALKITEDSCNCGEVLCEYLEMISFRSDKKARVALKTLAYNETSIKEDEKYILLMCINTHYGKLNFEGMFQSLNMECASVAIFLEWYLGSERNTRRHLKSEQDALDYYLMNLSAKKEEPEVLKEALPIYRKYCKNNKKQRKSRKRVIHAIKAIQRADKRKRVINRIRRCNHEEDEESRI